MTRPVKWTRRGILKTGAGVAAAAAFPAIVPSSVFGATAPSNRLAIGAIGVGRISRVHDMKETFNYDNAQIVAVCDLDAKRVESGKAFVNDAYAKKFSKDYSGTRGYADAQELLANKEIDGVLISVPDHQHAITAVHAVRAGKDVYLQKPASLTIAEGRYLSDAVTKSGRILQIGSQQRSDNPWPQFRRACELVRNGRIGDLKHVEVGLPGDPSGPEAPQMPVPTNLNYDAWLGSTPDVYYTEMRVHPQDSFDRPGWLRCEQFGAGMITGWGAHHVDYRALGHGHGAHRPCRSVVQQRRISQERPLECARQIHDARALRQRRDDGHLGGFPERHQVHRQQGLDLRCARRRRRFADGPQGDNDRQAARRERPEDSG